MNNTKSVIENKNDMIQQKTNGTAIDIDINENNMLRETPELLEILLIDRTTGRNIVWATNSYADRGDEYSPEASITSKQITGEMGHLIKPRVEKEKQEQKSRTKENAEVFTPTWVVKKQNDLVEAEFFNLGLEEYVSKTWLEITCGEAPYMCSRYDTVTGNYLQILERVGFVDRKLQRISKEVDDYQRWIELTKKAYQASYGYELQGDSLLLARENLLYTFVDYFEDKFQLVPNIDLKTEIAKIVSYNVFQMDGLKHIVPYSEKSMQNIQMFQMNLFGDEEKVEQAETSFTNVKTGISVLIMDWRQNALVSFRNLLFERGK